MRVRWLRTALRNLDEEASFIASDDSVAARLVVEQPLLQGQPAAVAGEASIGAYDPVAGKDERDGVPAVGKADRPTGLRVTDSLCQPTVARSLAVADVT